MATASPFLSMGKDTFKVSLQETFVANRQNLVQKLKESSDCKSGIIFLQGGPGATRFDTDHEPIFRQESYFWYLTGVKEPDCSVSISICEGKTTLFVPKLPPEYATIMGRIRTVEEWKLMYLVDEVRFTDEIEHLLTSYFAASTNGLSSSGKKLFLLKGRNSDSGNIYEPPDSILSLKALSSYIDVETLFPVLADCRVFKSKSERSLIRHVTEVTSFAHAYVMRNIKVGTMEYQAESLFRHYCYYNYGCRLVGYTPICGCGPNAAILHYGHAGEPNARQTEETDMCLFDMGAEYMLYSSDVTCSFPCNGRFTDKQRLVYEAVLAAQIAVYDKIQPGVSWVDCHKAAEATILKHLIGVGMVNPQGKTVDELVELRLGAVFMPHGLGHFVGIDTHDVGGYLPGHPERLAQEPGLRSLRTARILQENMVLTVEPGCYFIDHLLDEALVADSPLAKYLVQDVVQSYRGFGGVRLEDVVQVSKDGCVNFTLCPRTTEEVESVMAGDKWPPLVDRAPELRRKYLTAAMKPLGAPPSL